MPLSDLPLTLLVALFLALFVLVGIYPALQRFAESLRKLTQPGAQQKKPAVASRADVHAEIFAGQPGSRPLNDFEIIVLRRLAQANKALTLKQVNAPLLLGTDVFHKTLRSLHQRGMIEVKVSSLLGQRFVLSEAGHRYAVEQGYLVEIHERKGAVG